MGRCVEERSDTPVDPELADGSEPVVYSAVPRPLGKSARRRITARSSVLKAPQEALVARQGQPLVAPSRGKRLTARPEGTFSKTLLFEK